MSKVTCLGLVTLPKYFIRCFKMHDTLGARLPRDGGGKKRSIWKVALYKAPDGSTWHSSLRVQDQIRGEERYKTSPDIQKGQATKKGSKSHASPVSAPFRQFL